MQGNKYGNKREEDFYLKQRNKGPPKEDRTAKEYS